MILQYESINRINDDNQCIGIDDEDDNDNDISLNFNNWDLVIIDEAKSFFIHTMSPTHNGKQEINYINVYEICKLAPKILFLDGDNDNQVYTNACYFCKTLICENTWCKN